MKNKKPARTDRNWAIVVIGSMLIIFGLVMIVLAIANIASFGWWSLTIGLGGFSTAGLAITSIAKNDPSWILLDLIIPG